MTQQNKSKMKIAASATAAPPAASAPPSLVLIESPRAMRKAVHEALKALRKEPSTDSPLHQFRLYKIAQRKGSTEPQRATRAVIQQGIDALADNYAVEAQILSKHFMDGELVQNIANQLSMAEGTVYNKQSEAITRLADILHHLEQTAQTDYHCALEERLNPPSNTQLVGVDEHIEHLVEMVCTPKAPWIMALAGMGGIGKTTLADAVARKAIPRDVFDDVGWVTAQQQAFSPIGNLNMNARPALTSDTLIRGLITQLMPEVTLRPDLSSADLQRILCTHLNNRPHLIIVDNLETLADIETLIDTLRDLANPTKFLLTSRESLFSEPDIYHFSVPELTQQLTLSLVRQEAQLRNLPHLLAASDDRSAADCRDGGRQSAWPFVWSWGRPTSTRWMSS